MGSQDARERLLKAAIDLFYKKGYSSSSNREIATKAKISNSVIYHYFKNKEEMLTEIINIAINDLLIILDDIQERIEDPVQCLKEMLRAHLVDWFLKRKKEAKIIVTESDWLTGKRKEQNKITQRKIYAIYKEKLNEIKASGLLIDADLTVVCFSMMGIITQSIRWYNESGPLTKEQVAQSVIEFVFNGILAQDVRLEALTL